MFLFIYMYTYNICISILLFIFQLKRKCGISFEAKAKKISRGERHLAAPRMEDSPRSPEETIIVRPATITASQDEAAVINDDDDNNEAISMPISTGSKTPPIPIPPTSSPQDSGNANNNKKSKI